MPVYRSDRISEELMTQVAAVIPRLKDPRIAGKMLSVTRTEVSRDGKFAKVYVSVLGSADELKQAVKGLVSSSGFIRRELAAAMQLRYTPELQFIADEGIARAEKTFEALKKLGLGGSKEEN